MTLNEIYEEKQGIKARTKKMKRARLEKGYNQSDVCKSIGISVPSYSRIELGLVNPRPNTAKRICDFLQKTFDELFEIKERLIL